MTRSPHLDALGRHVDRHVYPGTPTPDEDAALGTPPVDDAPQLEPVLGPLGVYLASVDPEEAERIVVYLRRTSARKDIDPELTFLPTS